MSRVYEEEIVISDSELAFYNAVREYIICLLILLGLYGVSYIIIVHYKTRSERDELYSGDDDDYMVYRISVWLCTFTLCVSIGAALLLPFSIVGNEIHQLYPNSWYFTWLSSSLIYSLWNYVFLLSNCCLFILLPFAYFFIESQGFTYFRKGLMTRVYETSSLLALSIALLFCCVQGVALVYGEIWQSDLPYLYSYVSLFGVVLLLSSLSSSSTHRLAVSTPLGFARIFTAIGEYVRRPIRQHDISSEVRAATLEEHSIQIRLSAAAHQRELDAATHRLHKSSSSAELICDEARALTLNAGNDAPTTRPPRKRRNSSIQNDVCYLRMDEMLSSGGDDEQHRRRNGLEEYITEGVSQLRCHADAVIAELRPRLTMARHRRRELDALRQRSVAYVQYVKHPLCMIVALVLTGLSLLLVVSNTFRLMVGLRTLTTDVRTPFVVDTPIVMENATPSYMQQLLMFGIRDSPLLYDAPTNATAANDTERDARSTNVAPFEFSDSSLSYLGFVGATIHVIVIFYVALSSLVGLYSLPLIRRVRPHAHRTSMTHVIVNCALVLVCTSALPVLTNTLGLSPFDLLGAYGQLGWLSNWSFVLFYNAAFALATTLCLTNQFTYSLRVELCKRLTEANRQLRAGSATRERHLSADVGGHAKHE